MPEFHVVGEKITNNRISSEFLNSSSPASACFMKSEMAAFFDTKQLSPSRDVSDRETRRDHPVRNARISTIRLLMILYFFRRSGEKGFPADCTNRGRAPVRRRSGPPSSWADAGVVSRWNCSPMGRFPRTGTPGFYSLRWMRGGTAPCRKIECFPRASETTSCEGGETEASLIRGGYPPIWGTSRFPLPDSDTRGRPWPLAISCAPRANAQNRACRYGCSDK